MNHIKQFPHCDAKVLHAPSDGCVYCNAHAEWQELRKYWGIAYTGHSNDVVEYTDFEGKQVVKTLINGAVTGHTKKKHILSMNGGLSKKNVGGKAIRLR
jgi:hypothetical protein